MKQQHKIGISILLGAFVCTLSHNLVAQESGKQSELALSQGVIVGGGAIQANAVGPSVLGGWWLQLPLASWAYLSGGPTLSYAYSSKTHSSWYGTNAVEVSNTDTERILGLSLDAFLGLELLSPLSIEFGGNLGVASNAAKTTFCGKETYVAGFVGLEGGLALRVGQRRQFLASVHAVAVTLPALRCTNQLTGNGYETGPSMYHERDFETVGALLRLGILL